MQLKRSDSLDYKTNQPVWYGDQNARVSTAELRGRIGMLGHDLYLYPELSAAENLRFFASIYGMPDVERRVTRGLEMANLVDRADDPVAGFSRGMRQRLAVERALIHDPRLMLLDEPFTGLDEASRQTLRERLRVARAAGTIIILTTHDIAAIENLTDASVRLVDGRVAA